MPWSQIIQYPAIYFHADLFRLLDGIKLSEFSIMAEETLVMLSAAIDTYQHYHTGKAVFNTVTEIGIALAMLSGLQVDSSDASRCSQALSVVMASGSDLRRSSRPRKVKDRNVDNSIDGAPSNKRARIQ